MEIVDWSSDIFGNQINKKTIKKATKSKNKYVKKFGDSTFEYPNKKSMTEMLDRFISDKEFNEQIVKLKATGIYDGGYKVITCC